MATEKTVEEGYEPEARRASVIHEAALDSTPKSRWERTWPVFACGAGLFSDGYLNGVYVPRCQHLCLVCLVSLCHMTDPFLLV